MFRTDVPSGRAMQGPGRQAGQQPAKDAQPSWANVAGKGASSTTGWTTVANGKKKLKKYALDQIGEIMAVSTDRGLLEARECVEKKIGGQPICRVW